MLAYILTKGLPIGDTFFFFYFFTHYEIIINISLINYYYKLLFELRFHTITQFILFFN